MAKVVEEKRCEGCNEWFSPNKPKQRFHNVACRNRHTAKSTAAARSAKMKGRKSTGGAKDKKLMGRSEHRVNAEKIRGRPLRPGEVVHHLDGDHDNNSPYNVIDMSSQSAHIKLGHKKKRQV